MVKRFLDVAVSLVWLALTAPLWVAVAILIRLDSPGPVFFRQPRAGHHGRRFLLLKFRTMNDQRDPAGRLLPDSARLTRVGRFLRRMSIDEWPQVVNILRGEMSWVGPRPLLAAYLDRYTPEENRRHEAKPGITGWAQIHGRNALSWEERFRLDLWYVGHQSLMLDAQILARTLARVFRREGISQPGRATMDEFMGSNG